MVNDFDAQAEFLAEEIEKAEAQIFFHDKSKKDAEELKKRLEAELKKSFEDTGLITNETAGYEFARKISKPKVEIHDLKAVPKEFIRTKTIEEPDKIKINKHLKAKNKVNWACFSEPKQYIEIKRKEK